MYEQDMEGRVLAAGMGLKVVLTEMVLVAFKATWQGHISHVSVLNRVDFLSLGTFAGVWRPIAVILAAAAGCYWR